MSTLTSTPDTTIDSAQRKTAVRAMVTTLGLDLGLPMGAYFVADLAGANTYTALLAGTAVSGARLIWVAIRQRRVDAFAMFLMILFAAGLALSFLSGDPRFMLAKDSATSAVAGLTLLVSCVIGRPLAYYAAKRFAGDEGRDRFEATADSDAMRRRWFTVSLVWGAALLSDSLLRMAAVYLLPLHTAANLSQILMIVVYGGLFTWTIRSHKRNAIAA
ncbi:VC0807 family protein [Nocardia sp. NPDC088792]|uniref:VC0807 family protein n=1 Tax=Nocardia sp. NPDC088792 TaxID=3364332 RepID=UPI003802BD99